MFDDYMGLKTARARSTDDAISQSEAITMASDQNQPERPRSEPEILPPDHTQQPRWDRPAWRSQGPTWSSGAQRVYVTRLGPFGFVMLILGLAAVFALLFLAILGAALIWIPFVAIAVIVAAFFRWLR
jgi:hypothetical protein